MIAHPAIAALRDDDRPQRRAQEAVEAADALWRAGPLAKPVLEAIDAYAQGRPLADLPALAALFEAGGTAQGFAASFVSANAAALARYPLGHVAARHFADDAHATLVIARSGGVVLSLAAIDAHGFARQAAARSADFIDCEFTDHIVAGRAQGERLVRHSGRLERNLIALAPGAVLRRDGAAEAFVLRSVSQTLVMLRLQRRAARPAPTREVRIADGALLHQSAATPRDSRIALMMALARAMERTDAAPHLAAIALADESDDLRWTALREGLALDSGSGFATLCRIAERACDPLAAPADTLRSALLEQWPQLAGTQPCPA